MAYALTHLPAAEAAVRPVRMALWKRIVNRFVAARIKSVERELRAHEYLIRETALTHGEYRRISFHKADLLPFKA